MDDYIVRVMDMPYCMRGFVTYSPDNVANIYINAHLSRTEQKKALRHELTHVRRGDCFRPVPIELLEAMS